MEIKPTVKHSLDKNFPPINPSFSMNGIKADGALGRIQDHMIISDGPFLLPPLSNAFARSLGHRSSVECCNHGPNIYKDTNHPRKCRLFLKKVLGGRCLSVWGPPVPSLPPPARYKLYAYIPLYSTYSHREGREGVWWTSEKVRGAIVHKRGRKTNKTVCISAVYKLC